MEIIPAQLAKNQFSDLLMKVQRVAVVISPEEYDQFTQLKLQNLKAVLAESIAQADRGELHSIDDVFAPFTVEFPCREPHYLLPGSFDWY
ncbi:type II toxin-antitoxin system Phd/YefM family antitoxin [Xenorhabdus bovienii]|uniref:type II toxin-antitoxin system Phd/YefM family antitoxin n=1 Tax=Xenorhabdus bovienii TaxID=40576 RepID=UPI0023B27146|nr:type II toxin-antitoxin system Phd/YefM family antitoxin [Xenorhabdus bovienii]MDE9432191.1 type II toxin-antitoxin system Phd/YefM family antitoxin [Xenorhabdus bovienii]MDE9461245.1 type II toxin-antitoxin system Phd/YefM family antitoxin [Xenorhabdus bovienii]MDE9469550.1 type II toxin-antitoxin system Phd/YefM family antitoxin [Xenorhabdus bovienii]MDE9481313.1 type II toxin-antitoxin system Phd/YefM family antitoxin [Xenorhabdus bovienii]MDE9490152.1 type II toxin-antitoxin system Phd/